MTDITPQDRREVEKWVARMLDEPDRHRAALARWLLDKPGRRDLYERLMRSVEDAGQSLSVDTARAPEPPSAPRRHRYLRIAVAASLLVVAGGAAILLSMPGLLRGSRGDAADDLVASTLSTRPGELRKAKLADGSMLTLDADTQLHVRLSGTERSVDLSRGRIRLAVAPDDLRPFTVKVADSHLLASGGIFDVSRTNRIAINMLEGSLVIRLPGWREAARPSRQIRLQSGEMLAYTAGQRAVPSIMSAPRSAFQWASGTKSFDDVAISDVIAEANSFGPVRILLADPAMGERRIFGEIRIRDAESVARAIATFLDARIDRSEARTLIIRK